MAPARGDRPDSTREADDVDRDAAVRLGAFSVLVALPLYAVPELAEPVRAPALDAAAAREHARVPAPGGDGSEDRHRRGAGARCCENRDGRCSDERSDTPTDGPPHSPCLHACETPLYPTLAAVRIVPIRTRERNRSHVLRQGQD